MDTDPVGSSIRKKSSHTMEIDQVSTRDRWLEHLAKQREGHLRPTQGKIHMVPDLLQANGGSADHYKPRVVSLGPYHLGDDRLKALQGLKASMAERFVADTEAFLRSKIKSNIRMLMDAYPLEKVSKLEESEWEEMLFLDGCFVLYFIFCMIYNRVEDLKIERFQINLIHSDLFLLENQLPFQLLKILSGNDSELLDLVDVYILTHKISNEIDWYGMEDEPVHLLDRLRTIIIDRRSHTMKWQQAISRPWKSEALQSTPQLGTQGTVLRHAKELTTRGIHLRPSRSGFLNDIYFRSHFVYGTLKIPRIVVDDSTRLLLLNLAAYEMYADVDSTITSYICLMDSLVNHADDIKELQSAGILVNHLATDEQAANLFNEMSQSLHPYTDVYMDVKTKINKFFEHKTKASLASWIAEGYHNHFKSPLTAMAVLAAILALGLSATQTYFTIFPRGDKQSTGK